MKNKSKSKKYRTNKITLKRYTYKKTRGGGIFTTKKLTCEPNTLLTDSDLSNMSDKELHTEYQRCCTKKSWIGRKNKNKYCKTIVNQNKINKNNFKTLSF